MEHSVYRCVRIMFNDENAQPYSAEVKGIVATSRTLTGIRRAIRELRAAPTLDWRTLIAA